MSNPGKKNGFIKQAGILAAAGIICRIIGILYRSPLAAVIGDEGNGYYTPAYNIYTIILLVSSYSIPSAISKEISMKLVLKEYKDAQRVFHCAFIYVILVGGVSSLLTFFFADFLVESKCVPVLKVFAPTIFLSGLLGVFRGYFQAHKTLLQTSVSQIIEQVFNAVISITLAYLLMSTIPVSDTTTRAVYGAAGSAVGTGSGVLIALLFMCSIYLFNKGLIQKRIRQDKNQISSYRSIFSGIFRNVTPLILSTFIYNSSTALNQTVYHWISSGKNDFSEYKTSIQYGIFAGKAVILANIPIALSSAMSSAVLPGISAAYAQGDIVETNRKIDTAIRTTMLITIPAAVGLSVLARPIVQLLFPQVESVELASGLLRYLCISVLFYSLSTLTNVVLQGIGKPSLPMFNAAISLVIQTVVLVIALINTGFDTYCLVMAAIVYSFLMCVLNEHSVRNYLGYRQNIKKNYIIPLIASAIMGVAAFYLYRVFYTISGSNVVSLFSSILLATVIYFIMILKLNGLSQEELESLPYGKTIVKLAKKLMLLS